MGAAIARPCAAPKSGDPRVSLLSAAGFPLLLPAQLPTGRSTVDPHVACFGALPSSLPGKPFGDFRQVVNTSVIPHRVSRIADFAGKSKSAGKHLNRQAIQQSAKARTRKFPNDSGMAAKIRFIIKALCDHVIHRNRRVIPRKGAFIHITSSWCRKENREASSMPPGSRILERPVFVGTEYSIPALYFPQDIVSRHQH